MNSSENKCFLQSSCQQLIFDLETIFFLFFIPKFDQLSPVYQRHETFEYLEYCQSYKFGDLWQYNLYFPLLRSLIILLSMKKKTILSLIRKLGYRSSNEYNNDKDKNEYESINIQPRLTGKKAKQLLITYNLQHLNLTQIENITRKLVI